MNSDTISTAQLKTLQAEYSRLKREDDPRTHGPNGEIYYDTREGRIAWAQSHLGTKKLESFTGLTHLQAEYLIDTLKRGHNQTKLDIFIASEFKRLGVHDPESYFQAMLAKKNYWTYGGRSLPTLNRWQKCALARLLSSRGHAAPARERRPSSPPARRVSTEQQGLWPGY